MSSIEYNGHPVVIHVSHVTELGEGYKGSRYVATCSSMEELNLILNDPKNKPDQYWQWQISFQDYYGDENPYDDDNPTYWGE